MSWFRSNRCNVVWLALFALVCQAVLVFDHVHLGKARGYADARAVVANAGHQGPAGLADDFCATCASISLANTLVIPTSPVAVPPNPFVQNLSWHFAAIDPGWSDHLLFDARGPPHA